MRFLLPAWTVACRACLGSGPAVTGSDRTLRPVVTGLGAPSAMAFLTAHDFLIVEKFSGGES